jgi:ribosome biogenesis ATPase
VIFFDEFDALCPKRSDTSEGGGSQRVVNQLLTEMDGIEERKGVFLMAATNRPDIVDPAVLRPGRLDKILYVGLPDEHDRADILRAVTKDGKKPPIADDVDMDELAAVTNGFTGADLAGLIRQAALQSLKSSITGVVDVDEEDLVVKKEHILEALANVKPSVSDEVSFFLANINDQFFHFLINFSFFVACRISNIMKNSRGNMAQQKKYK